MKRRQHRLHVSHRRGITLMALLFAILVIYAGPLMLATALVGPLMFLGILIPVLCPLGRATMGGQDCPASSSLLRWLIRVFLLQIAVVIVVTTLMVALLQMWQQSQTVAPITELLLSSFAINHIYLGVQPWTAITLVAITQGVIGAFHGGQKTSETLRPLLGYRMSPVFASGVDVVAVFASLMTIFLILALSLTTVSTLLSTVGFTALHQQDSYSVLLAAFMTVFFMLPTVQAQIHRVAKQRQTMGLTLLLILSLWIVAFICFDSIAKFVLPAALIQAQLPWSIPTLGRLSPVGQWLFTTWLLSALIAPYFGALLNRISQGRQVREVVAAFMVGPTIMAMALTLMNPSQVPESSHGNVTYVLDTFMHVAKACATEHASMLFNILCVVMTILAFWLIKSANECLLTISSNQAGKKHYRLRAMMIQSNPMGTWLLAVTLLIGFTGLMSLLGVIAMLSLVFCLFLPFLSLLRSFLGVPDNRPGLS